MDHLPAIVSLDGDSLIRSIRNRFLFGFYILKARLSGEDHVCASFLCEAVDQEQSKPFFLNVVLSASSYQTSLSMLEKHIVLEGGILQNIPEVTWIDDRLYVPPGVSQTDGGRVYFDE